MAGLPGGIIGWNEGDFALPPPRIYKMFDNFMRPETLPAVKWALVVWWLLLIPWLPFASVCGMAFDGGHKTGAYIFVWSTLTYPVALAIAMLSRQKSPELVVLPLFNIAGFFLGGFGFLD